MTPFCRPWDPISYMLALTLSHTPSPDPILVKSSKYYLKKIQYLNMSHL